MKRTPEQVLGSMDRLAADLTLSGMRGYARRLRRVRTEIADLFGKSAKPIPRKMKLSAPTHDRYGDMPVLEVDDGTGRWRDI